jgi:hypothetical protein
MRCGYCNEEIDEKDPNYGLTNIHFSCAAKLQNEMEKLGIIKIVSRSESKISYKLTPKFDNCLQDSISHAHTHIIHDDTVDEDIVDMQGVIRAIHEYVGDSVADKELWHFSSVIFNGLMIQRHGYPLLEEKKFHSRAKEFYEEIYSIGSNDEEELSLFKRVFHEGSQEKVTGTLKTLPKMVEVQNLSEKLDKELDEASDRVLDILKKIARKIEKSGASKKWRNFRMDELLLQTVKDMIIAQLQNAPIAEIVLGEEDIGILNNSIDSMFADVAELSSAIARKHKVPLDVVLARMLNNVIMNLILHYVKMKSEYARNHGLM